VRLWFESIVPIHVGAEKAAEEHRNPNCIGAVLWSGFEQEHADGRILGESIGENAAGASGAHHDVVERFC
jgi:hypothetical protein